MASKNIFDHWQVVFLRGKVRKTRLSQPPLIPNFDLLKSYIFIFLRENKKNYHRQYFSLDACSGPMCSLTHLFLDHVSGKSVKRDGEAPVEVVQRGQGLAAQGDRNGQDGY